MKKPKSEMMGEGANGFGIRRRVPRAKVETLEWLICEAAQAASALGVDWEHFRHRCEVEFTVAPEELRERIASKAVN